MKGLIIKIGSVFLLFLFLTGTGCKRDSDYEIIPIEYLKCPCSSDMDFIKSCTLEKVVLFDSTKTTFEEMRKFTLYGDSSTFVSYNPESNNAVLYSHKGLYYGGIGYICNFPEAAKYWEIPYNGIRISFSADIYETCRPCFSVGGWISFSDNVLTSFKKYDK